MLHTLNLCSAVCQLYLNKTGRKKSISLSLHIYIYMLSIDSVPFENSNATANFTFNVESWILSLYDQEQENYIGFCHSLEHCTEDFSQGNQEKIEIKNPYLKIIKLSLFVKDMTLYTEIPMESTKKSIKASK